MEASERCGSLSNSDVGWMQHCMTCNTDSVLMCMRRQEFFVCRVVLSTEQGRDEVVW